MRKKYALSRIGAVALLASSAIGGANAQVRAAQQSAPASATQLCVWHPRMAGSFGAMCSSTTDGPVSAKTITLTDGMNLWLKTP